MKRAIRLAAVLLGTGLALPACTDEQNPAKQYGNTMADALKTTKQVGKDLDVLAVQRSIQEFQAANGRYPADLDEVAAFNGAALDSERFEYDPATGTLTQRR